MDVKTIIVIIVIVFGLTVYLINMRKMNRQLKQKAEVPSEREKKLFQLYQNIEDLMDGFEEYVEDVKGELKSDKEEIRNLKEEFYADRRENQAKLNQMLELMMSQSSPRPRIYNEPQEQPAETSAEPEEITKFSKSKQILELFNNGAEPEQIVKQLGVSMSEVSLAIGLFKTD